MAPEQRRLRRMGGSRHAGVASRGTPTEPMIGEHHPSSVGERCACSALENKKTRPISMHISKDRKTAHSWWATDRVQGLYGLILYREPRHFKSLCMALDP